MDRFARNLGHEKQGKIKSVHRRPEYFDGKDGDMQIYNGRLYIKDKNVWHHFVPKSEFQITRLADDTGGTISDTLADVPGSYTEATLANQLASLSAKINKIIELLQLDIR